MTALGWRARRAFAEQGLPVVGETPFHGSHRGSVLRATLEDGTVVRLRRYSDTTAAARVHQCLRSAVARTLPIPLGRAGRWLATAFTEGTPLPTRRDGSRLARWLVEGAALLARIHASPRPRQSARPLAFYSRGISLAARRLVRARRLPAAAARRLQAIPRPTQPPLALTHGDFSPDNLIVSAAGRLAVVDEERVAVRPLAYDLARTVCLWQLDSRAERRLLAAYTLSGGDASSFTRDREFWIASALATSILYRLRYRPAALPPVIAAFRAVGISTPSPRRRVRR